MYLPPFHSVDGSSPVKSMWISGVSTGEYSSELALEPLHDRIKRFMDEAQKERIISLVAHLHLQYRQSRLTSRTEIYHEVVFCYSCY